MVSQQVDVARADAGATIRGFMAEALLSSVLLAIRADEVQAPWTRTLLGSARSRITRSK